MGYYQERLIWLGQALTQGIQISFFCLLARACQKSLIFQMVLSHCWAVSVKIVSVVLPTAWAPFSQSITLAAILLILGGQIISVYLAGRFLDRPPDFWQNRPFYWTTNWILPALTFTVCILGLPLFWALGLTTGVAVTAIMSCRLLFDGIDQKVLPLPKTESPLPPRDFPSHTQQTRPVSPFAQSVAEPSEAQAWQQALNPRP